MSNSGFWVTRLKSHGHTGWADLVTYSYDQPHRINLITGLAKKFSKSSSQALDYGCGSGDFSFSLSKIFSHVTGFEIAEEIVESAQKKNGAQNIQFTHNRDAVFNQRYNFILSVTVLQHVLKDEELNELIGKFRSSIKADGAVLVLETFSEKSQVASEESYMNLRPLGKVREMFEKAGFELTLNQGFYHPTLNPTKNFEQYRSSFLVRAIGKLARLRVPLSKSFLDFLSYNFRMRDLQKGIEEQSPTRILLFRPKSSD